MIVRIIRPSLTDGFRRLFSRPRLRAKAPHGRGAGETRARAATKSTSAAQVPFSRARELRGLARSAAYGRAYCRARSPGQCARSQPAPAPAVARQRRPWAQVDQWKKAHLQAPFPGRGFRARSGGRTSFTWPADTSWGCAEPWNRRRSRYRIDPGRRPGGERPTVRACIRRRAT
jgi:hypothetical protein